MYHSRTKKVASYGRRAHRVVAVLDDGRYGSDVFSVTHKDTEDASCHSHHEDSEEDEFSRPAESVHHTHGATGDNAPRRSRATSSLKNRDRKKILVQDTPKRKPLGLCQPNIPKPSVISPNGHKARGKGKGSSPGMRKVPMFSPHIDVDIVVLDERGQQVDEERRVTKNTCLDKAAPKPVRRSRRPTSVKAYSIFASEEDEGDDDDYVPMPQNKKKDKQGPAIRKDRRKSARDTGCGQEKEPRVDQSDSGMPPQPKTSRRAVPTIILTDSESDSEVEEEAGTKSTNLAKENRLSSAYASRKRTTGNTMTRDSVTFQRGTGQPTQLIAVPKSCPVQSSCRTNDPLSSPPTRVKKAGLTFARKGISRDHKTTRQPPIPAPKVDAPESQPQGSTPIRRSHSQAGVAQQRHTKSSPSREPIVICDDDFSLSMDVELELALQAAELQLADPCPPSSGMPSSNVLRPIKSNFEQELKPTIGRQRPRIASFLRPLLSECGQLTTFDFATFIETFPADPIIGFSGHTMASNKSSSSISFDSYQKIGEASYSEVFGIGNVVLKIIPLLDEESDISDTWAADWESPAVSEAQDVLKEIVVTRAIGQICKGFIKLLKAHVVRGPYPPSLLALWDRYTVANGSESVRPDHFTAKQTFAVIVLPNGGPDLENLSFNSLDLLGGGGWRQAGSIFWQVVRSLGHAEELVHFEHRDLHWGQILVRKTMKPSHLLVSNSISKAMLDDPWHGVQTTVIDLGLSRIDHGQGDSFWTAFEEEIFEGKGDYQYDVYRMMREHNNDEWRSFRPLTNVMWIHYLVDKLIHHKHLRAPPQDFAQSNRKGARANAQLAVMEADRRAYECLVETEHMLRFSVAGIGKEAGVKMFKRLKSSRDSLGTVDSDSDCKEMKSATDVLRYGKDRGWIM